MPIILGVLIRLVGSSQGLAGPPGTNQNASETLLLLVVCACLAVPRARSVSWSRNARSTSGNARPAYRRAPIVVQLLVLGVIAVAQSIVLVLLGLAGRRCRRRARSSRASAGRDPARHRRVALASMCLGLLVSALVSTSEKAMPFLVLLTMIQVILSGGVISLVHKAGLSQLAMIAPSRWGSGRGVHRQPHRHLTHRWRQLHRPAVGAHPRDLAARHGRPGRAGGFFALIAWFQERRLGPRRRKGEPGNG